MNTEVENHGGSTETRTNEKPWKGWRRRLGQVVSWMDQKENDNWLDQMRENLSIIATLIATMTFQMALNPPGGVRPVKEDGDDLACYNAQDLMLCPGQAVLALVFNEKYSKFLRWNTICFISSLSILLLLVSGVRLNHRFPMWILLIGMCLTLTSLALTYLRAVEMVTPEYVWTDSKDFQRKLVITWIGFSSLLVLFITLRIISKGVKHFLKKGEGKKATSKEDSTRLI